MVADEGGADVADDESGARGDSSTFSVCLLLLAFGGGSLAVGFGKCGSIFDGTGMESLISRISLLNVCFIIRRFRRFIS